MTQINLSGRSSVHEPYPLPAASGTRGPVTLNATASGDTEVVAATAGASIVVTSYWLSNRGSADITAALREGTTDRIKGMLAANGGGVAQPLHPHWKLPVNTALNLNLSATGNVDANVQFYLT